MPDHCRRARLLLAAATHTHARALVSAAGLAAPLGWRAPLPGPNQAASRRQTQWPLLRGHLLAAATCSQHFQPVRLHGRPSASSGATAPPTEAGRRVSPRNAPEANWARSARHSIISELAGDVDARARARTYPAGLRAAQRARARASARAGPRERRRFRQELALDRRIDGPESRAGRQNARLMPAPDTNLRHSRQLFRGSFGQPAGAAAAAADDLMEADAAICAALSSRLPSAAFISRSGGGGERMRAAGQPSRARARNAAARPTINWPTQPANWRVHVNGSRKSPAARPLSSRWRALMNGGCCGPERRRRRRRRIHLARERRPDSRSALLAACIRPRRLLKHYYYYYHHYCAQRNSRASGRAARNDDYHPRHDDMRSFVGTARPAPVFRPAQRPCSAAGAAPFSWGRRRWAARSSYPSALLRRPRSCS